MARRIWARLHHTTTLWSDKGGTFMAASQAFHIALAFLPLVLLAASVLGLVLRSDSAEETRHRLIAMTAGELSPALGRQLGVLLDQVQRGATLGGQIGIAALLGSLLSIFYHMQKAFDQIWEVPPLRLPELRTGLMRYLGQLVSHFFVWIGIGILLLLVFAGSLVSSVLQNFTDLPLNDLGAITIVPSTLLTAAIFALVYKSQPRTHVAWRDVWSGAILAALLWEAGRQFLSLSMGTSRYGAYGIVGAFLIVMVWLYLANSILYLGAMYVRARTMEVPVDSSTGSASDSAISAGEQGQESP